MEGSFWRLGHDLADFYSDRVTVRQLWVRVQVVLEDLESPLRLAVERDRAADEETDLIEGIDDALAKVGG